VAIPLVALLWSVIGKGAGTAFAGFPAFFTEEIPAISRQPGPGMGPAIAGTLLITAGATLISVPLGVLGAIYLHEYSRNGQFARDGGEAAPLLFAVGAAREYNLHFFDGANTALSVQIFSNANSAFAPSQERAWGAALTLVLVTFLITLLARMFTARLALKR